MAFFSYSQLAFYKKCPFRFYLERVRKVEAVIDERRHYLGTVLAYVMDEFYKSHFWRAADPLPLMRAAVTQAAQKVDLIFTLPWTAGERDRTLALAMETLPTIVNTMIRERLLGLRNYTEFEVDVPVESDHVVGRADLIIVNPGGSDGLVIVDGKAGGTFGRHVSMDQLRFYALGALEHPQFRRLPDRVGFWWFRHGRVIWRTPTQKIVERFRAGVAATIGRLRANEFPPRPTADCRYCDVKAHCPDGQAFLLARAEDDIPLDAEGNLGVISL